MYQVEMPRRPTKSLVIEVVPKTCHFRFAMFGKLHSFLTHVEVLHSSDNTSKIPQPFLQTCILPSLPNLDTFHSSFSGRFNGV